MLNKKTIFVHIILLMLLIVSALKFGDLYLENSQLINLFVSIIDIISTSQDNFYLFWENEFWEKHLTSENLLTYSILELRLPRILMSFWIGGILAISGCVFQRVFQNSLVSPDILGVSLGSALGGLLAIALTNSLNYGMLGAIIGGALATLIAVVISYSLNFKGALSRFILIIVGILVSSFFASAINLWKYFSSDDKVLRGISYLMMGSFSAVTFESLLILVAVTFPILLFIFISKNFLELLLLPIEILETQGIKVRQWSFILLFIASILISPSVATVGVIGWISLVIPNVIRYFAVKKINLILYYNFIFGGASLLLADTLARTMIQVEIPIGVLTGIMGVPIFIFLIFKDLKRIN